MLSESELIEKLNDSVGYGFTSSINKLLTIPLFTEMSKKMDKLLFFYTCDFRVEISIPTTQFIHDYEF